MLREWLAENIGLDENGSVRLRRLDLLEMEKYSTKMMDNPESSSEEYWQAKTMHEGIVKTFKEMSPVARIEYWDCLNDTPRQHPLRLRKNIKPLKGAALDEQSSTQRFRVLLAGISEGETRILYNIEKGRLTADILKSNIGRRLLDAGLIRRNGQSAPSLTKDGIRLVSTLAQGEADRPIRLYERNSETLLRQAGQGTANAYKAGFENAAVELLNDKLVRLDIATGALTLLPAGRELLERLEQTS